MKETPLPRLPFIGKYARGRYVETDSQRADMLNEELRKTASEDLEKYANPFKYFGDLFRGNRQPTPANATTEQRLQGTLAGAAVDAHNRGVLKAPDTSKGKAGDLGRFADSAFQGVQSGKVKPVAPAAPPAWSGGARLGNWMRGAVGLGQTQAPKAPAQPKR